MLFHVVLTHKLAATQKKSICIESRDLKSVEAALLQSYDDFYRLGNIRQVKDRQGAADLHKRLGLFAIDLEFVTDEKDQKVFTPPPVVQPEIVEEPSVEEPIVAVIESPSKEDAILGLIEEELND